MKTVKLLLSGIILSVLVLAGFAKAKEAESVGLADGNNQFAIDLYSKLKSEDGNIFFSPYSISTALGMTYEGARNNTEKQMAQVLHFTQGPEKTGKSFGALQTLLNNIQKKDNIQLGIANAIWAQNDYKFLQSYLDIVQKDYKSKLNFADFKTAESCENTRKEINTWVEDKTNDKIKNLIAKRMILRDGVFMFSPVFTWFGMVDRLGMFDLV